MISRSHEATRTPVSTPPTFPIGVARSSAGRMCRTVSPHIRACASNTADGEPSTTMTSARAASQRRYSASSASSALDALMGTMQETSSWSGEYMECRAATDVPTAEESGRSEESEPVLGPLGDLPPEVLRAQLHRMADWVADYRETIERRAITPSAEPGAV